MTGTEIAGLVGVLFLFVVGLVMLSRRRGSSTTSVNPLTGKFEHIQGSEPPGVSIKNAETTEGSVNAKDNTGGGVELDGIKAKKNIVATNNPPPDRPKA